MIFEREAMKQDNRSTKRIWGLILMVSAGVTAADDFEISRSTIDGGGVMRSTGGDFELSGTIGQPDAGIMLSSDGEFQLSGGFWFPLAYHDCNSDGCVDLVDYYDFEACLSGPEGGLLLPECNCFDLDGDDDIDLFDIARFQQEFAGG